MSKHAPLPWTVAPDPNFSSLSEIVGANGNPALDEAFGQSHPEQMAKAELIVRAVNAHEELVRACSEVRRALEDDAKERGIKHEVWTVTLLKEALKKVGRE